MSEHCFHGRGFYGLRPSADAGVVVEAANNFAWAMGHYDGAMAQEFHNRLRAFWHRVPSGSARTDFEAFAAYAVDHVRPFSAEFGRSDMALLHREDDRTLLVLGFMEPRHVIALVRVVDWLFRPFSAPVWTYSWAVTSSTPLVSGCSGGFVVWNSHDAAWSDSDPGPAERALSLPDFGRAHRRLADYLQFDPESVRDQRLFSLLNTLIFRHPQSELLVFEKLRQWAEEDGESE